MSVAPTSTAGTPLAPPVEAIHPLATGSEPGPSTSPAPINSAVPRPQTELSEAHPSAGVTEREAEQGTELGSITPPVPKCHIRFLVISGQSHVFSFEPEITVGRMKEIIWSSWPSEWTSPAAPPSPAFLRILHSGRILQDDSTLSSCNIAAALQPTQPTVMHISVRSFSLKGDEGDPKKGGNLHPTSSRTSRRANDDVTSSGCKCVIM